MAADGGADVVVVAAGVGVKALEEAKASQGLDGLHILPLQPFESFPDVLGSADVLLAVIDEEAGEFSVPSKVLSYLCAQKPIVLSAPEDNLAAQIIVESGAGKVVPPGATKEFVSAAKHYIENLAAASVAGMAGRKYAEDNFELSRIADQFEVIVSKAVSFRKSR